MRWLLGLLLALIVIVGGAFFVAGRGAPPRIVIDKPDRFVGHAGSLEVTAEAPGARFTELTIVAEQQGRRIPLFSLRGAEASRVTAIDRDKMHISRPFGKEAVPELQPGPARIVVTAARKSILNLRTLATTAVRDVQVKLDPPRLAVVSTKHYVNHGGSEMVVYRVSPPESRSGVRVGDLEYPGYPAAGAGVEGADPGVKVAFFALLHDQDLNTPIALFAADQAGNQARVSFVDNVFAKPFKRSRIEVSDAFMQRVVPEILANDPMPQLSGSSPSGDLLPAFYKINSELRRINTERIAKIASKTSPARLWREPFVQLGNSQVEAAFADHRTYIHNGQEFDQQVHLGFDLAVTSHVPVVAANDGIVLNAAWLGIYGNCVIIDHGMGVASLYGHLSSFEVKEGDRVTRGQRIGRSGMTGLAAGDHLHFTMLVNGRFVNPVEWWDPHWIQDRVDRKLQEASSSTSAAR